MSFSTAVTTAFRWFDRYTLDTLNVMPPVRAGREPIIRALEDPHSTRRHARSAVARSDARDSRVTA